MRYLLLVLCLFLSTVATAQNAKVLSISAEGSVDLPADIIQFNINLNAEADGPQKAYDLHKQREDVLVQLLERYDIEDRDINFEPVSISRYNPGGRYSEQEADRFRTQQAVAVKLTNFDIYERMQVALIEAGFDSFSGSFSSSEAEAGKDRALRRAIQTAKEKAALIANEAGVEVGTISGIDYSHNEERPMFARNNMAMLESSGGQLLDFKQVVTVTARISIEFTIE